MSKETFAANLRAAINATGLSIKDFSEGVKVSPRLVQRWCSVGVDSISKSQEEWDLVAKELGVTFAELSGMQLPSAPKRLQSEIVVSDTVFALASLMESLTPKNLQAVKEQIEGLVELQEHTEATVKELEQRLPEGMRAEFDAETIRGVAQSICDDAEHRRIIEAGNSPKATAIELLEKTGFGSKKLPIGKNP